MLHIWKSSKESLIPLGPDNLKAREHITFKNIQCQLSKAGACDAYISLVKPELKRINEQKTDARIITD